MDLFKRLYNIARAEMPARGASVDEDAFDASQRFYASQRGERDKSSEQDPVLAAYYANLELPYGADIETVRRSWKRLMKQYHPDMHSTDANKKEVADELCAELTRAYQELTRALSARP
jgi:DnaJ-domain-containing protein 1